MKNLTFLMLFTITQGCGVNSFKALEPNNAAAQAALRLEAQEAGAAIEILLGALGSDYTSIYNAIDTNTSLSTTKTSLTTEMYRLQGEGDVKHIFEVISMLSSAHAQLHGIDPLDVALTLARSDSEESATATSSTGNDVTKLFPILPAATADNILGLDVSIMLLQSIESINYSESDSYKEAIFLTSSVSLVTKALDLNADGEISASEVLALQGSGSSGSILNQLRAASAAMSSSNGVGNSSETADGAAKINAILTEIDGQSGDSDEDKLISYLSQNTTTTTLD
ncbi:MAG: hypothetical protein AB8C84_00195 [Oligoflexales bacterium]